MCVPFMVLTTCEWPGGFRREYGQGARVLSVRMDERCQRGIIHLSAAMVSHATTMEPSTEL